MKLNPQFIEKSFDRKASSDSVANKQSSFVAKNNKENSMNTKYFNGRAILVYNSSGSLESWKHLEFLHLFAKNL